MNDTIYRQDAIEEIYKIKRELQMLDNSLTADKFIRGLMLAYDVIEQLPAAQPEIIRCKDCKHQPFLFDSEDGFGFPDEMCPCQCEDYWYSWRPNDDWFCGNAERRTDEIN